MDSPDSSQHLMSVSENHIKAAFKYPKYISLSAIFPLGWPESQVNFDDFHTNKWPAFAAVEGDL